MRLGMAIAIFAGLTCGSSTFAQESVVVDTRPDAECSFQPESEDSCVRFVGCFVQDGVWFSGQTRGWDGGEISLQASDGDTCTGAFAYRSTLDMGKATLRCDKRDVAEMSFFNRGGDLNVVTGTGVSPDGQRVQMWAGEKLAEYLAQTLDEPLTCGDTVLDVK